MLKDELTHSSRYRLQTDALPDGIEVGGEVKSVDKREPHLLREHARVSA